MLRWRGAAAVSVIVALCNVAVAPAYALARPASPQSVLQPAAGTEIISQMYAPALRRAVQVAVYLPPGYRPTGGPYPVLYLLHGYPGSGPQMMAGLQLPVQMDRLIDSGEIPPTVVVAPSDGPSAATDTEWVNSSVIPRWRWGTFVRSDLVAWADATYAVCTSRSGRFIGGVSMGGYGAADAMVVNPGLYSGALLLSPYFVSNTAKVSGKNGSKSWSVASPLYTFSARVWAHAAQPERVALLTSRNDGQAYHESRQFEALLHAAGDPSKYTVAGAPPHNYNFWAPRFADQAGWLLAGAHC